ncbi:phage portal protein [Paenibacillus sp. L3-i20]|uniref:phage tail assembly chaperone n=1 Tax=Paenibacillus sp. L3-i20 TaxID=2905833 RepID=UPI001EE0B650|nr:phage portal protein [Paenibacillus sp. L3-i20]GKU75657.1 phage portal protein [Paenibacillus sp. L3-i20]
MSDLSLFFAQNVTSEVTEEIAVSNRFRKKDGATVLWKIRSMTEGENEECRKASTRRVKGRNGQYTQETSTEDYLALLVTTSVVHPDLKNVELQKSYGVMGAETLLRKMLLPGEYAELVQNVQRINGFDQDMNELVQEVKN